MDEKWKGWQEIGLPKAKPQMERWLDLSYPLSADMPRVQIFPQPDFRKIFTMPKDPLNVTEIHMACHVGTHVDAPRHFFQDGPTFDKIPLDRLYGPGVVWHIDMPPYGVIEPGVFEKMKPAVKPGDILILDTGWAQHFPTQIYNQHPSLSTEAAHWLVEHQIKLLAVDFGTPDLAANKRKPGFNWPVHHVLLSHGVLVSEHVRNLGSIAGKRIEAIFLGLNIEEADGAPARVIARPIDL
jgi:arylformamidase